MGSACPHIFSLDRVFPVYREANPKGASPSRWLASVLGEALVLGASGTKAAVSISVFLTLTRCVKKLETLHPYPVSLCAPNGVLIQGGMLAHFEYRLINMKQTILFPCTDLCFGIVGYSVAGLRRPRRRTDEEAWKAVRI